MKTAIATLSLLLATIPAFAQVCGDVDDTGKVTAGDALRVLKTAVGIDVPLVCDTGDCLALETRMDTLEDETLIALDGDGDVLGRVVGDGDGQTTKSIFVKSLGKIIRLGYVADEDETGFQPIGDADRQYLHFTEANCQGTPFVVLSRSSLDENYVIVSRSNHAFVVNGEKSKPHLVASSENNEGACIADVSDISGADNGNHVAVYLQEVALPFPFPAPGPFQIKPLR